MLRKIFNAFGVVLVAALLSMTSCQKDHYRDSGVHTPNFDGSILDYLKTRPDIFDTLVYVLELTDLDQVIDKEAVTFFAPTDMSIHKAILALNQDLYTNGRDTLLELDQIDPEIWREFMGMYILDDHYLLKDFPQLDTLDRQAFPGQGYAMRNGRYMNIGVLFNDVVTENDDGTEQVIRYAGYRQLYLNNATGLFVAGPVATSDIQPTNGVLHVLNMDIHTFGFTSEFRDLISLRGIKPIE